MANILVEGYSNIPSVKIFFLTLFEISNTCDSSTKCKYTREITRKDLKWCDIFITIRGREKSTYRLASACKKAGKTVAYVLDDDLLSSQLKKTKHRRLRDAKWIDSILKITDILITGNEHLGQKYAQRYGLKTCKINTIVKLNPREYDWVQSEDVVHMVYAAGADHGKLFETIVLPALTKLPNGVKKRIDLTVIGPRIIGRDLGFPVFSIPSMKYDAYNEFMDLHHYDIGFAPLYDDEFYKCKYINKYLEYGKRGTVCVFSDTEPYNAVIKTNVNGFLARDIDQWSEVIKHLVENRSDIERIKCEVIDDLQNYSVENISKQFINEFPEYATHENKHGKVPYVLYNKALFYIEVLSLMMFNKLEKKEE